MESAEMPKKKKQLGPINDLHTGQRFSAHFIQFDTLTNPRFILEKMQNI
jgi:hypothetical protein